MDRKSSAVAVLSSFAAAVVILIGFFSIPLAAVVTAAAVIALVVFFDPFKGLIIYIVIIILRPQDFIPGLARVRVALLMAIIIIAFFIIHKVFRRESFRALATRQNILMLLMLVIVPVSVLVNTSVALAWEQFNEFLTVFFLFFMVSNITDNMEKLKKIVFTILLCVTLICLNGVLQHFRGYDILGNTMVVGRITWVGIFGDPNDLALLVNSFFPLILLYVLDRKTPGPARSGLALLGALYLLTIYYTNSRGGFIALAAVLILFTYKKWGPIKAFFTASAAIVVIFVVGLGRLSNISPYEASASGRVFAWIHGLVLLKDNPLIGVGFQQFYANHGLAAHSAFIECMAELGLIGYFIWLTLLYTAITSLIRAERYATDSSAARYIRFLQLSFAGFIVSSVFLNQAYSPVLYILIGLTTVITQEVEGRLKVAMIPSPKEFVHIAVILAGTIVLYKILAMVYI